MMIGSLLHQDARANVRLLRPRPKNVSLKPNSKSRPQLPLRHQQQKRQHLAAPTEAIDLKPPRQPRRSQLPTDTMMCSSVEDWMRTECDLYRAMHVRRRATWAEVQDRVDEMAAREAFGANGALQVYVPVDGSVDQLRAELSTRAQGLLQRTLSVGLPQWLYEQMLGDAEEIGMMVGRMLPGIPSLILKVEMMGENSCQRWHQDHYTCRAIVSYNGCGTEYLDHSNVNFWELQHCGKSEHILRNEDEVFSAGIGDILFMKGSLFPSRVNGLVHKSPGKLYHPDGRIVNRLVLKVDVA